MDKTKDCRQPAKDLRQRSWPGRRLARSRPGQDDSHERLTTRPLKQHKNCSNSFHSEVKL